MSIGHEGEPAHGPGAFTRPYLRATRISHREGGLRPAARTRAWMDATTNRFANRCLPLLIANQAGWFYESDCDFMVVWNGGSSRYDTCVVVSDGPAHAAPISHFGHGIITFSLPYVFRTSPGYNILARGPSNWPKDGIAALEGVVETDWTVASFTMNWKLTRPGHAIRFSRGEPVC